MQLFQQNLTGCFGCLRGESSPCRNPGMATPLRLHEIVRSGSQREHAIDAGETEATGPAKAGGCLAPAKHSSMLLCSALEQHALLIV